MGERVAPHGVCPGRIFADFPYEITGCKLPGQARLYRDLIDQHALGLHPLAIGAVQVAGEIDRLFPVSESAESQGKGSLEQGRGVYPLLSAPFIHRLFVDVFRNRHQTSHSRAHIGQPGELRALQVPYKIIPRCPVFLRSEIGFFLLRQFKKQVVRFFLLPLKDGLELPLHGNVAESVRHEMMKIHQHVNLHFRLDKLKAKQGLIAKKVKRAHEPPVDIVCRCLFRHGFDRNIHGHVIIRPLPRDALLVQGEAGA